MARGTDITPELQERLARRVAEAERRTRAEFVTVVARRAGRRGPGFLIGGGLAALALPGVLWAAGLVQDFPRLYLAQIAAILLLALVWYLPALQSLLEPKAVRQAAARRLAEELFQRLGLHRAGSRGAVLLFVALAERRVEILADEAAELALPAEVWGRAVAIFEREAAAGDLDGAFALTLNFLAERLEQALPRLPSDRNQLGDALIVL